MHRTTDGMPLDRGNALWGAVKSPLSSLLSRLSKLRESALKPGTVAAAGVRRINISGIKAPSKPRRRSSTAVERKRKRISGPLCVTRVHAEYSGNDVLPRMYQSRLYRATRRYLHRKHFWGLEKPTAILLLWPRGDWTEKRSTTHRQAQLKFRYYTCGLRKISFFD